MSFVHPLNSVVLAAAVWLSVAGCAPMRSSPPDMRALEAALADTLGAYPDAMVAVAVRDLASDAALSIRGDRRFHAASTIKVPVMIEVFRQVDAGSFALDDALTVRNRFASIVDGAAYAIEDDSDDEIYGRLGTPMLIRVLTERMITQSSNLATNMLIELVTADSVQQTIEHLGAVRMQVRRGVEDLAAFRQDLNNTATADDLATMLRSIADETAATPAACRAMVALLKQQAFDDMIPAGLPADVEVAHKTGWITGVRHDAAIVYPPDTTPYVLVVLTEGRSGEEDVSARLVARIARLVHTHLRPSA